MSRTLTLRPKPAKMRPHTLPPADPAKISLSQSLGWRFIDRKGRYILQARAEQTVTYEPPALLNDGTIVSGHPLTRLETTWIDVPLVPEVYG